MVQRTFFVACALASSNARPTVQVPFLSDVGELFGVQFAQPKLQLPGVFPFLVPPLPKISTSEGAAGAKDLLEGQQVLNLGVSRDNYEMNERGQFLNVDSYARAMTDQLGVPYPVSRRIAEVTKAGIRQMTLLNSAISDWLGAIENGVPDPAAIGEPWVVGMDAAANAIPQPALAASLPVLSGMMDLFLTGLSTAVRIPSDFMLEGPRYEMSSLNELIEVMAPIVANDEADVAVPQAAPPTEDTAAEAA
eukprot:Gregarina_sp_Poly_1__3047@NODE_1857_length_3192_cov_78_086400_g199_i2_p3_GENE_NODE_1857_length_3192_cov_78_086400_g199_i2NODE_1857_length_3192_cov_78_086400_g199_i2_p3_ORF_typecomplete_len249_score37_54_NODE_1857_length_3192_cov_78_086400_g199_i23161062